MINKPSYYSRPFYASASVLLQGKTTVETLVKKEREPRLHLSWTHSKHPSYATAGHISQPAWWLALDRCHMWIYISPLTAPGQCHPFQLLLVHARLYNSAEASMSGQAAAGFRLISVKMCCSIRKKKKKLSTLPLCAHQRCQEDGWGVSLLVCQWEKKQK